MPSCKDKKKSDPLKISGITPSTRHYQLHGTISELAQGGVFGVSDDDVIEDFDFQKLAGAYQVASCFDVCFRWRRLPARFSARTSAQFMTSRPAPICSAENTARQPSGIMANTSQPQKSKPLFQTDQGTEIISPRRIGLSGDAESGSYR